MLGVVSYGRPSYLRRSIEAFTEHCDIDRTFVYVDGFGSNAERNKRYEQLVKRYRSQGIDAEIGRRNTGVGKAKNVLFRKMLDAGADWLIIAEDDIIAQSEKAVTGYVDACELSGLHHLMFHAHGPGNKRALAAGNGVLLWPDYVGAYAIYSRECLEACGLFDENFQGALEHVEHSVRLGEAGYTAPWKCAADATDSELWLEEIAESIEQSTNPVGSVKSERAWAHGCAYWKQKDPDLCKRIFDERGRVRQNVPLPEGIQGGPAPVITAPPTAVRVPAPKPPTCEPAVITDLSHYHHVYAAPGWQRIVTEHCEALVKTGMLDGRISTVSLGICGPEHDQVADFCRQWFDVDVVAESEQGWEQLTLTALWEDAQRGDIGDAVLYTHTKGITEPADYWRGEMTDHLVADWEKCVKALEANEVVGCHWMINDEWRIPFFGGNFWWARRSVIERLPQPPTNSRWEAEVWLGQANPVALDVNPGHPRR